MRWLLSFAALCALVYLALAVSVYVRQRQIIYYPVPEAHPAGLEALWLDSGGVSIKVWRLNADAPHALVYLGGNAEDVHYAAEPLAAALPGYALYLVNYRGYGGSSGEPTETGLYRDALTAIDRAASGHRSVSVIGRSIGSAVAVHAAARRDVDRLALVTPFDSVESMARRHYPLFPVSLMLKDKFLAVEDAPRVTADTLVVIAAEDRIVPRVHGDRLAEAMTATAPRIEVLAGEDHNSISQSPEYWALLEEFFARP